MTSPPPQLGSQIGQFIESAISGQPGLTGQLDGAVAEVSKFSFSLCVPAGMIAINQEMLISWFGSVLVKSSKPAVI